MVSNVDMLFVQMAEAKGYLEPEHAEEALILQRRQAASGERHPIRQIVLDRGWMTEEQVAEINGQITGGWEKTGKIEGYKLLSKIGQGGMGAVYKAERLETGELCALKILPGRLAARGDFVERFLREARAASRMRSEHIVRPVDVGISGGYYYFAMEYVEGESVDTTLAIDGPMAESKALRIVHQIALALADAEKTGMVHRDIKPGNIIVTADGLAKLTDFGLARETDDQSMTQAGMTLGTPNYMSPEQARAVKALDIRSDIYSLGVTFYHMLAGVLPFQGETSMLTMLKHLNEPPVAPITRRPDLSPGCNAVCLKMLAKDRNDRYQHARELAEDTQRVLDGQPPRYATLPASEPDAAAEPETLDRFAEEVRRQDRVKWVKTGSLLFALLLVGFVAYRLMPDNGPTRKTPTPPSERHDTGRLERAAQAELDRARAFAEAQPERLVEIVEAFRKIETDYAATKVRAEAGKLRAEAQQQLDQAIRKALQRCDDQAGELAEQDRFREALAVYEGFPKELLTPEAAARLERGRQRLNERAWASFRSYRQKAEGYLAARRFVAARKAVEPAVEFGISGIATEARQILSRIEQEEAAATAGRTGEALRAYQADAAKVRAFIRAGRFDAGLAELDRLRQAAALDEVRQMLARSASTHQTARQVWDAAMAGLAAMPGDTPMTVGAISGTFLRWDPKTGRIHLNVRGGKTAQVPAGRLTSATLRTLAEAGAKAPLMPIHYAAFFLVRGEFAEAAAELRKAREEKASTMLIQRYEEQLALLQNSREEIEAENLYTRAKELTGTAATDHAQRARTLWDLVSRFAHTQVYTENREEIETMLERSEAESITVDTLFAVKPADAGDGLSELKYDFSDLAHARDWLSTWEGRTLGRWTLQPVYGEMSCNQGNVYFKVPLQGNQRIDLQAKDLRTASIRLAMPDPSASPRAAGLSFHWARTADGAESSLELADKRLGAKRQMPGFQVVGSVALAVEMKDGVVTAFADGRVVHREKAEVASGYIVLAGFNAGARLTQVVLRSKLDRDALDRTFVQPLRTARREEARWRMADYQPLLDPDHPTDWRRQGPANAWTVAEGYATAREGIDGLMTGGDVNWRDYLLAARVLLGTAPGDARLMVRWTDTSAGGRGYAVDLAAGRGITGAGGRVRLSKVDGARIETLREVTVDLPGFDWQAFFVEVRGSQIRVLRGGDELIRVKDETHAAGRVGLASFKCGARFYDVKIKTMP